MLSASGKPAKHSLAPAHSHQRSLIALSMIFLQRVRRFAMLRVASALPVPGRLLLRWWLISRLDKPLWCWPIYNQHWRKGAMFRLCRTRGIRIISRAYAKVGHPHLLPCLISCYNKRDWRDDRVVEGTGLENRRRHPLPWVRIPLSPPCWAYSNPR